MNIEKLREILSKLVSLDRNENAYAIRALSNCTDELLECVKILNSMLDNKHAEYCDYADDEECKCGLIYAQETIAALSAKLKAVK